VAQGLADEFAHGAALPFGDGLGAFQHVRGQGYGEGSGVSHGDIYIARPSKIKRVLAALKLGNVPSVPDLLSLIFSGGRPMPSSVVPMLRKSRSMGQPRL
jgi:hypothetical protein